MGDEQSPPPSDCGFVELRGLRTACRWRTRSWGLTAREETRLLLKLLRPPGRQAHAIRVRRGPDTGAQCPSSFSCTCFTRCLFQCSDDMGPWAQPCRLCAPGGAHTDTSPRPHDLDHAEDAPVGACLTGPGCSADMVSC